MRKVNLGSTFLIGFALCLMVKEETVDQKAESLYPGIGQ